MGVIGLVLAVLTGGYFLGVWTGGLVFKQHQGTYEDAVPTTPSSTPVIVPGETTAPSGRRW
jgi:hypothetical protein